MHLAVATSAHSFALCCVFVFSEFEANKHIARRDALMTHICDG